ncbi:MAG: hypothetical protein FWD61_14300 [Phycisphaerales bacterium]|nr:hypothetical protein [Phycisphaerales bacterium]
MSMGDWQFVLICTGVIVVVAAMVFVPVRMARIRQSRWTEAILAGAMLWGVLMAGSVIYSYMTELRWEKEQAVQIASGYFEPGDASRKLGKPGWPWGVWVGLMAGYAGICAGAAR